MPSRRLRFPCVCHSASVDGFDGSVNTTLGPPTLKSSTPETTKSSRRSFQPPRPPTKSSRRKSVQRLDNSRVLRFENNNQLFFNLIWPHLDLPERRNMRAACTLLQNVANKMQTKIRLSESARDPTHLKRLSYAFPNVTHLTIVGIMPEAVLSAVLQLRTLRSNLVSLDVHTTSFMKTSAFMDLFRYIPKLQHLAIRAKPGSISPAFLASCTRFRKLTSLHLAGCQALSSPNWIPLAELVNVTHLHLEGIKHLPFHTLVVLLSSLEKLSSLTLTSCAFQSTHNYVIASGPSLVNMAHLSALSSLTLDSCTGIPTSALHSLPTLPNLRTLVLPSSLPPTMFLPLSPTIKHVDLSNNICSESIFTSLRNVGPLTSLKLSSPSLTIPPTTLSRGIHTLKSLDLTHCSLPPQTLHTIFQMSHLTHLAFSTSRTTPPPSISQLTSLKSLACNLTLDRSLVPLLASLPHLQTLSVKSILLWPNSGNLSALTHLCATSCHQFGDHDWYDVADTTHYLQSLELHSCSHISDAGLANIAVHLPRLLTLKLTGLFKVSPTGCVSLIQHKNLREISLGLPRMSQLQLFSLTQQMAAAGLYAVCGNEEGAA